MQFIELVNVFITLLKCLWDNIRESFLWCGEKMFLEKPERHITECLPALWKCYNEAFLNYPFKKNILKTAFFILIFD